jgi:RNA polymerase sigma-70 factor (ECF subfamily)
MPDNMKNITDEVLYTMLANKDGSEKSAFDELYSRYASKIYSYCLKVMASEETAQDIFQEAFTRVFESAKKNTSMQNFAGFLIKITRNLCLNEKSKKHNKNIELDDFQFPVYDKSYAQKELMDLLQITVDELPLEFKEAFILKEYMNMSYKEIAEELNLSVSTVRIRIYRARLKIKEIMAPYISDIQKGENNV